MEECQHRHRCFVIPAVSLLRTRAAAGLLCSPARLSGLPEAVLRLLFRLLLCCGWLAGCAAGALLSRRISFTRDSSSYTIRRFK